MKIEDAALSGAFQVLFDRLVPKVEALKYILALIRGPAVENDMERFKNTWMAVKALLNDAEEKQYKNEAVKLWLDNLKDAAYDAEDLLDEFATEALREKLEAKSETISNQVWRRLVPAFLKFSVRSFNGEIESKIKAISRRFDDLASKRFELGLEEIGASSCSSRVRETSSVVDESRVYGRDDDREKIIELLLKDDSNCDDKITVIPIVGMGGVGKTTLAQIVYNDERVKRHFNMKTWVCVSEEFDVKRITKSILKSVASQLLEEKQKLATSEVFDSDELNLVQVEVKKALNGKKVLVVLDDLWSVNYDDWDVLQNPFRVGALGTKIIVTTRIIHIASRMGTVGNHYLGLLSKEHCWSVFAQHAFWSGNIDAKPNLAVIGKKIVEKCKGLPLAAKTLGGLLRSNLEEDEWEDILNSKIWELPEKETSILPALRLSYHHLPADLKRCFAYCSILPKDYEFREEELVLLWIAEGLVLRASRGKQMEDLAVEHFRDLVSRSFFQPSSTNKSLFVMHDLVNDLAQWVAGETCFRLEDKFDGRKQRKISKKARHSSYVGSEFDGVKKFEAFDEVECLRTFLPLKTPYESNLTSNIPLILLPKLRWLRVLSLAGYHITELPESISDLKHLRYLDLSRTKIICLPESTSTLHNLQMLILKDCYWLEKLPIAMGNLINLRLLDITNANKVEEMPLRVGKLTSLRKLSNFIVGNNSGSGIGELANLKCLRGTLCISSLENVINARDAREANLKDKQDLDVLSVKWSSEFNCPRNTDIEKEVLDMLQPHNKLKELNIKCYGGTRFPMWIGDPSFSNMVLLRLEHCVNCSTLPPLGQLSSLKDLCIEGMDKVNCVGLEFYGEGCPKPFPSLEALRFTNMQELKDWFHFGIDRQVEAFLCLRKLSIKTCPKLSGNLPGHLPSLEKLRIRGCQKLSVSISSMPKLCKLSIQECLEVVNESTVCLSSLKSMGLLSISNRMCLTEGFMRGLTKVENLQIATCNELMSLWQNEEGLLQLLPSLRHLIIRRCPEFVSLVGEEEEQLQLPCILEHLELESCDNLEKLQGLHSLSSLKKLTIKGCSRLVSFPDTGLPSMLRELRIEGCNDLKSVPQETMCCSNYASLEYLCIEGCNSITSITKGQLPSITKKLEIRNCLNLKSLVEEEEVSTSTSTTSLHNSCTSFLEDLHIESCPVLKYLSSRGNLPATLKHLKVKSCSQLESIAVRLDNNASLESICIWDCENLKSLPEGLYNLFHLSSISIDRCPSLVFSFPDGGLPFVNSLECIQFWNCESLRSLPMGLHNLSHLSFISIYECPSLVSFPDRGLPATNLQELYISCCEELVALPHHMHKLTSLQKLTIETCPGIVSFPEEGFPPNLTVLNIRDLKICKSLFDWGLHKLTSLRELVINGGCSFLVSFPEEEKGMILPTSIIRLTIQNFPNLKYLSTKGFQNLTSLEYLWIEDCLNLKSFPEEGLPPSLLKLNIFNCPLLREEWPKIAHIPSVSK